MEKMQDEHCSGVRERGSTGASGEARGPPDGDCEGVTAGHLLPQWAVVGFLPVENLGCAPSLFVFRQTNLL